ncbi:hypothetical protein N7478_012109 [Penicillium angulare]|uniref:uncharacterized protein n=1 Tax=Penicillium angulare TaxID=116970 RepID=UPI00253FCD9D|nr:uncharacterized protein N7478_012109 [Penicillium angulare]KAJ5260504.1 hypothetical protein N7478_012109 [Penicillium angulare]
MLAKFILVGKILIIIIQQSWKRLNTSLRSAVHRFTYQPGEQPKSIVVIGASFAGYQAARCLANSLPSGYRVVVIEKNTHFQLTWVLPRFCVVDGHDNKAFIPYGSYMKGPPGSWQWINEAVQSVLPSHSHGGQSGRVQLASGREIEYEYLVLATGSSATLPSRVCEESKHDGMKVIAAQREKITQGKHIVVIGGGPAGIELAGDAKTQFPDKEVTLVHSRKTLLNDGFGLKLHDAVCKEMENLGVNLVLGEKPVIPDGMNSGDIKLSGGETIHFDCLIKCVGQKPNSHLVQFLSPDAFSRSGHIRVRSSLQVVDDAFPHIFAAGDLVESNGIKNARAAFEQAQVVAENVCRSIQGKSLIEYKAEWWEGTTKITLGIGKSLVYITDRYAEVLFSMKKQKVELDSGMVWKHLGQKPFIDPDDKLALV